MKPVGTYKTMDEIRLLTERGEPLMIDGEEINVNSHWHVAKFPKYLY